MQGVDWYKSRSEFRSNVETLRKYLIQNPITISEETSFAGARGAMVIDVITSRQRNYEKRVVAIVHKWCATVSDPSLRQLSENRLKQQEYGLRVGEAETIQKVAQGLLRFGVDQSISGDDSICLAWANAVEDFRFTPKLDPYVGSVDGMGIALFAYARKLSGVDAIKPDVRVRQRLKQLGINVPDGSQALMLLCEMFADELDISRSQFDTYLWQDPTA